MTDKPEHVTPEMIELIKQVTDAEIKDREIVNKWKAQRRHDRKIWEAKPEEEKQALIRQGLGFQYDTPEPTSKWVRNIRRKIRYRLFRIREGKAQYDKGLKAWMEKQFTEGMVWWSPAIDQGPDKRPPRGFTFDWDVSASEPLKIITPMEWISTGGTLMEAPGSSHKMCDPSAFTEQEM